MSAPLFADINAIVIDLDGTLVDSAPDIAYAMNTILARQGLPEHAVKDVRNMIGGGIPKILERGLRAHGADASEQAVAKLLPDLIEFYSAHATRETYIYPGGEDLLRYLKAKGLPTAICTNKSKIVTDIILRDLEIMDCFDVVVGGSKDFPKKPDPASLKYIMAELGSTPDDTIMIGDSGVDVGAARNAGMKVAIMNGGYTKTPASELGADHVFDSFHEVLELLQTDTTTSAEATAPEA